MDDFLQIVRICLVIALVVVAAILSTPRGRVPLALRGVLRILRKDRALAPPPSPEPVPGWKKLLAFVLVILAFILAKI